MKYDWTSGGYDYLQAFGMSPRNASIAGYIVSLSEKSCSILDVACGLCPIVPFLPENLISRYVAFDNSAYVEECLQYKEREFFEFHRLSFDEFFCDMSYRQDSFDFVLYLGMYGGYDIYAERLKKLLPYAKSDGYIILEAIDEHIADVLSVMREKYSNYKEIASCNIQIYDDKLLLTRERFRSIHIYQALAREKDEPLLKEDYTSIILGEINVSLYEVLKSRGYSFRQHLEEESWTRRKLTVVDLDDSQRSALERGGIDSLKEIMDRQKLWSFPAMDIEKPLSIQPNVILAQDRQIKAIVIAPKEESDPIQMAHKFIDAIFQQFGVKLALLDDTEADLSLLKSHHIVLFGGSHENQFAMDMALKYQSCFVDATVPGDDGWIVTTHVNLDSSVHNVAQITASPSQCQEALAYILQNTVSKDGQIILLHTHYIYPGRDMREYLPSWEKFSADLPKSIQQLQDGIDKTPDDPVALADILSIGFESGGQDVNIYNLAPVDIAVRSVRYYQLSGDIRALRLFRELLFRLADYYLKTPDGASYISDLDFRLGHLILYYSRLEHHTIFSEEDRLILANLLLSCTRSIYEYTLKFWHIKPEEPTRHNHETFAALSLLFASDYYNQYGIPYTDDWRARADLVFSGEIWNRFKQRENANHYEQYAFEHAAIYSAFTGHRLDLFDKDFLRRTAIRQVITTDNFFRPVDYGDSSISMKAGTNDTLISIVSSQSDDPTLNWYAHESFRRQHHYLPLPIGIRRNYGGESPPSHVWELLPLDPKFINQFCPGFPQEYAFDKLAFRSGWADDDHFIMLEGVGNQEISHSHNELNGIVRLNHLGRHWIVSNGYGRLAGLTNVNESFNTRVLGPEDHNMLVLKRNGEIIRKLPVCNALLQMGQVGDLAFATGALLNYGGTDWFRTLIILADQFVLVIDRIHIIQPGLEAGHIEWNCLGKATIHEDGFRLDQQGVFMNIISDSGWVKQLDTADRSADWKRILESGSYPYADFPLPKLIFQMPDVNASQWLCLSTLLTATRMPEPAYRLYEPKPGLVRIEAIHDKLTDLNVNDKDLSIKTTESFLDARFNTKPILPEILHHWSANAE